MRLLGNDLIDLKDSDSIGVLKNTRFLKRVLNKNELSYLQDTDSPYETAWLLWGAKEAAYKALKRKIPETIFSPEKISIAKSFASLEINNFTLTLQWKATAEWIHVWCHNLESSPEVAISSLQGIKESHLQAWSRHSSLCRQFAVDYLEKKLKFKPQIKKEVESPRYPPVLYKGKEPLAHLLSLSHHGRYCALAFYQNH